MAGDSSIGLASRRPLVSVGGLERAVVAALAAAGVSIVVASPPRVLRQGLGTPRRLLSPGISVDRASRQVSALCCRRAQLAFAAAIAIDQKDPKGVSRIPGDLSQAVTIGGPSYIGGQEQSLDREELGSSLLRDQYEPELVARIPIHRDGGSIRGPWEIADGTSQRSSPSTARAS
jgi:hypothetical protein